jgi:hypothetical protein
MMIEYDFDQTEPGDVTPRWPALQVNVILCAAS